MHQVATTTYSIIPYFAPMLQPEDYQWIELFSGTGVATRCVSDLGYRVAKFDINMAKEFGHANGKGTCWDFMSPAGFAILASN